MYSDYYENHQLAGVLDVYLPLVKMDLSMEYTCKAPISTLEEYICRCIKQGITDRYGMMDALALEDIVVNHLVDQLIQNQIIKEESGKLHFTNIEYALIENIKSVQHNKRDVIWCYKGLMNADKKIDTHMKSIEQSVGIQQILEQEHAFYLLPNILIEVKPEELKALNAKMLHYKDQDKEEVLTVDRLEILKARTVVYKQYKILFFRGVEGNVKLLVHKAEGNQKVDEAFTRTLQRMYDRSELFSQIRYTSPQDDHQIVELIKQIGFMAATK